MWTKFVHGMAPTWLSTMTHWITDNPGTPVLVICYEDILIDPVKEVKKILRFLNVKYGAGEVEERLKKDYSVFHRRRPQKQENEDVYTKKLQSFVNSVVSDAERFVVDNGLMDIINVTRYHRY